jgi:flagellar basal-body rod protein FlgB
MPFEVSKAFNLAERALGYRSTRQDLISSNIANVDTPNYRPKDIRFENFMIEESNKVFNKDSQKLQMASTNGAHITTTSKLQMASTNGAHIMTTSSSAGAKADIFYRDGHMARNDGNSVDIDVETTEMSKNGVMYNALVGALRKDIAMFKMVVDSSGKI